MATEQEILANAARDGTLDVSEWPRVLENVLQRLHDIVHSEFPRPSKPTHSLPATQSQEPTALTASPNPEPASGQAVRSSEPEESREVGPLSQTSSDTNKENTAPLMPPPPPTSTPLRNTSPSIRATKDEDFLGPFPELAASYQSSIRTLKDSFANSPPYTIQRLAELVLDPTRHYRYLPPYLNALDRIVSVSSPTTGFPLPQQAMTNGILQTNGEDENFNATSGDEGLGGALLTPIPWLRNQHPPEEAARQPDGELHTEGTETIDGPNGAGRIETVSVTVNGIHSTPHVASMSNGHQESHAPMTTEQELREQGAVTQGELLRQEQEAGVVPVTQITARRGLAGTRSGAMGLDMHATMEDNEDEEVPHARGPDEIGMEDLGPQEGAIGAGRPLDLEAALGRSPEPAPLGASENAEPDQGEGSREGEVSGDASEGVSGEIKPSEAEAEMQVDNPEGGAI